VAFFNRPNHLGCTAEEDREAGLQVAQALSSRGLETEFVDDIKFFVWKKMILKCSMASICAVANKTIKDALEYGPTREIADACFREALAVARAMGYDPGEGFMEQALGYLAKVGVHRDSMCFDIENRAPTEIDFWGAKLSSTPARKVLRLRFL
jgi:2-dehydropantoate 2-reductase